MAASGTITGTTNNTYITAKVEWEETATSATSNTSTVKATLYYKKSSSSTSSTYGTLAYSLTVNGTSTSGSKTVTLSANDTWVSICSNTVTVTHSSDGTKSITISATGGISGTSFTSTTLSGTATLTSLDRTAPTITISSTSSTYNSITFKATSDVSCNTWQYSTNGGSSYTTFNSGSATSVSKTISSLSANTTYSLRVRAYKVANNISSYASTSVTTTGASTITSAVSKTITVSGTACSVTFTPYSTAFYYTLTFALGSSYSVTTDRFCPATTSSYTYTGYSFTLEDWGPYMQAATSATCTCTLITYSSITGSQIGDSDSATFTLRIPSTVVPSVDSITVTEANSSLPSAFSGYYVQSLSKFKIVAACSGSYGSYVSSINIEAEGETYSPTVSSQSGTATTDTITSYGTLTIEATATDSRGRTGSGSTSVTVVRYYSPTITGISLDISGTTVKVTASGSCASVNSCNTAYLTFTATNATDSTDTQTASYTYTAAGSYSYSHTFTLETVQTETYTITVSISDATGTTTTQTKSTGVICFSRLAGGTGAAFGREAETKKLLDVAWNIEADGYILSKTLKRITGSTVTTSITSSFTDVMTITLTEGVWLVIGRIAVNTAETAAICRFSNNTTTRSSVYAPDSKNAYWAELVLPMAISEDTDITLQAICPTGDLTLNTASLIAYAM